MIRTGNILYDQGNKTVYGKEEIENQLAGKDDKKPNQMADRTTKKEHA